jgi:signal transduction histidine kinase
VSRAGRPISVTLFGVIALATAPPITIGLLQIRTAGNAGRQLLATQLDAELERIGNAAHERWDRRQGTLLLLATNEVTRAALRDSTAISPADAAFLQDMASRAPGVERAILTDRAGRSRLALLTSGSAEVQSASGTLPVMLPVTSEGGETVGQLRASVSLAAILPITVTTSQSSPPLLAVFAADGTTPLNTPALPPHLFQGAVFEWEGHPWLARRRSVVAPPMIIALVAPLDPFVSPFARAASQRTAGLVAGSALALLIATILAARLSRSVQRLVAAADDVAQGNLARHIDENGTAELGRLAHAFNAMTAALDHTLRRLAQRESLAAVGEFAASLAHEIRNPLTAIHVDLQHLVRRGRLDGADRETLERSVRQVQRLDRAVSGALDIARGGRVTLQPTPIGPILRDAIAALEPELVKRGAHVESPAGNDAVFVLADASALHQVILNLLLNAASALPDGGTIRVSAVTTADDVAVTVADNGAGIPAENLERVFDAFFSTRPGGTGLGLAIAKQIVTAHGGCIEINSVVGRGTTVRIVLRSAARLAVSR